MTLILNGQTSIRILEEITETGGHYQCFGDYLNVTALGKANFDYSWPMPISVYGAAFTTTGPHNGDEISVIVAPQVTIGTITQAALVGATIITVSQSVIDNMRVGYYLTLTDGVNTNDVGRCKAINETSLTLTVEIATTSAFALSPATYCKRDIKFISNYKIEAAWQYAIGAVKIGGAHVPANTTLRFLYDNKSGGSKKLPFHIEYTY